MSLFTLALDPALPRTGACAHAHLHAWLYVNHKHHTHRAPSRLVSICGKMYDQPSIAQQHQFELQRLLLDPAPSQQHRAGSCSARTQRARWCPRGTPRRSSTRAAPCRRCRQRIGARSCTSVRALLERQHIVPPAGCDRAASSLLMVARLPACTPACRSASAWCPPPTARPPAYTVAACALA